MFATGSMPIILIAHYDSGDSETQAAFLSLIMRINKERLVLLFDERKRYKH